MPVRFSLFAAIALPFFAFLCAMSGPANPIPMCRCTAFRQFNPNIGCGPFPCSTTSEITDNLTCSDAVIPGPCPISGSITVTFNSCTVEVCATEEMVSCPQTCAFPVAGARLVSNQGSVGATVDACCASSCQYIMRVTFYGQNSSNCSGGSLICTYAVVFECKS